MRDSEMVKIPGKIERVSPQRAEDRVSAAVTADSLDVHTQILGAYKAASTGSHHVGMEPGVVYESFDMVPGVV